jgi:hypothetical protein
MRVDRSKPSEVTVTIDGKVYKTSVYPELPKGYRIYKKQLLGIEPLSSVERLVADIDAMGRLWCRHPIDPEEMPALIAFLQVAR